MIHYHGTPFSGDMANHLALAGKHAMVSFAKPDCMAAVAELCQSFTIDNGAFSAWKAGIKLDLEGYLEFVQTWALHPGCDWWLMPDVIDGTEKENEELIRRWKIELPAMGVPIWHLHESLEWLNELAEVFPRVALGSSGDYAEIGTPQWWDRMAAAMDVLCDENGAPVTKIHGLRMLDPTVFSHFPFASADSTNVARNIGLDSRWEGPYAPQSRKMRALLMMERIEVHASAAQWHGGRVGAGKNDQLFG